MIVRSMTLLFSMLTVVADLAVIVFTVLAIAARHSEGAADVRDRVWERAGDIALPMAFLVGLTCTLGSLYYSEIAHFDPCKLCWFQRIAMYPLPLLLGIATLRRDRAIRIYAIPMALVGASISIYHYQLERFPNQTHLSCTLDSPCTTVWFWKFHYISLPMMALSGFLLIAWLTWIAGQSERP
jgi:Disulfide bond formation protein DsbB